MERQHTYELTTVWTGNNGDGTKNVRTYDRSHTVSIKGKPELFLTTDTAAVGDLFRVYKSYASCFKRKHSLKTANW